MRVKKRGFVLEFSQLSCPWSNENKSCMRVDEIMVHDRNDDNSSTETLKACSNEANIMQHCWPNYVA